MTDQDDNIAFKLFDTYFSGLPAAATPLSTEPMLVFQGGTTKQVPATRVGGVGTATSTLTFTVDTLHGSDSNSGLAPLQGNIVGGNAAYTPGLYGTVASPIPLTGGSGVGATAIIGVSTPTGNVVFVVPVNSGTGYRIGDVLSANSANIGGTGSGFTFTIVSIVGTTLSSFATIQHAVSVGLSFSYQDLFDLAILVLPGTYHENVGASDGPFLAAFTQSTLTGLLIGDPVTPTNVRISPNSVTDQLPVVFFGGGGIWQMDGFSLVANDSGVGSGGGILDVTNYTQVKLGNMDFSVGTNPAIAYEAYWTATSYCRITCGSFFGNGHITFHGTNPPFSAAIAISIWSRASIGVNIAFNSAINLGGVPFFQPQSFSTASIGSISFTTPGNITGGTPINIFNLGNAFVGQDPTLGPASGGNWPGGSFDPTQIDDTSNIDGNTYGQRISGVPTTANLYSGAWGFFKDTVGGGVYAAYNDAGTIKKVALV